MSMYDCIDDSMTCVWQCESVVFNVVEDLIVYIYRIGCDNTCKMGSCNLNSFFLFFFHSEKDVHNLTSFAVTLLLVHHFYYKHWLLW